MKAYITPEAMQRMQLYIDAADGEISGLGTVYVNKGVMLVDNVYLLEQESSYSQTELKPEAVGKFLSEWMGDGGDPEELKLWWHSHGRMSVFWSSQDESTAKSFANGWMLSIVGNKDRAFKVRLDVYEPVHLYLEMELEVACDAASRELVA